MVCFMHMHDKDIFHNNINKYDFEVCIECYCTEMTLDQAFDQIQIEKSQVRT